MASCIDELLAREGGIDSDFLGINAAHAADLHWWRERGETERDFLGRVRAEARAAGYRNVRIMGDIEVDNVTPFRRPASDGAA